MKKNELVRDIEKLGPWFHQIEIEPGIRTRDICPSPGPQPINHPWQRWQVLKEVLPPDMSGMRVLDIGCADGFFSIELAKRGAQVVAIDAAPAMVERLKWAAQEMGLKNITARVGTLEELEPSESYDAVCFIAVLYHLKSPLLGLETLAGLTKIIYLETTITEGEEPFMFLKPPQEGVHNIPKWFPTRTCVEQMLKFAGFNEVESLPDPLPSRAIFVAKRVENQ